MQCQVSCLRANRGNRSFVPSCLIDLIGSVTVWGHSKMIFKKNVRPRGPSNYYKTPFRNFCSRIYTDFYMANQKPPSHLSPAARKWWRSVVDGYHLEPHELNLLTVEPRHYRFLDRHSLLRTSSTEQQASAVSLPLTTHTHAHCNNFVAECFARVITSSGVSGLGG